jgi:hypothetical protein
MSDAQSLPSPLAGLRVLELADEKGKFCGKLLGDLGADVIKIEPPGGERNRTVGPFRSIIRLFTDAAAEGNLADIIVLDPNSNNASGTLEAYSARRQRAGIARATGWSQKSRSILTCISASKSPSAEGSRIRRNASFQHVPDPKFAPDLFRVDRF